MPDDKWQGASFKPKEDYSKEASELLDRINATTVPALLRSTNKSVDDLVEELLVLEKVARLGDDVSSNKRLAVEALRVYRTQNSLDKMLETLDALMKKRAQAKQVQVAMIDECALVLKDGSLPKEKEVEVLERLAHVTDNKIHVELEHARFTIDLAKLHVAEGRKRPAYEMLRGLHIETIMNMPRVEKLVALNQQIRLCLELEDYEQTPLVSRKINYRALGRAEAHDQKLEYFSLMSQYYVQKGSYFNVGRCWYETYVTLKDTEQKLSALSAMVVYYLLAEHSSPKEIEDSAECCAFSPETKMLNRVTALSEIAEKRRSDLEDLPQLHFVLLRFNSIDLIREKTAEDIKQLCASHPELAPYPDRQELLNSRSSEHDLMVVSRFYTRIPLTRLAELVGLSTDHTEAFIMAMVTNKTLYAKMDRVDGLVVFEARKSTTEVMSSWNEAVGRTVSLLDKASHLITKERMLHNMPQPVAN